MAEVPNQQAMRGLGVFLVILGLTETGLAANIWDVITNERWGAWYGSMFTIACGACGALSNSKRIVIAGIALSVLSIILCFAGMITDGLGYAEIRSIETCYNTRTGETTGNNNYQKDALQCVQGSKMCQCVDDEDDCFRYNLSVYVAQDCNIVTERMRRQLVGSVVLLVFCWVFSLVYMIIAAVSLGGIREDGDGEATPKASKRADPEELPQDEEPDQEAAAQEAEATDAAED